MNNQTDQSVIDKVKKIISEAQDGIDAITDECIMEISRKGLGKTTRHEKQPLRILIKFGNQFAQLGERILSELESESTSG